MKQQRKSPGMALNSAFNQKRIKFRDNNESRNYDYKIKFT